ncbi:peroxisomal multifunctional enzyme A-like [Armigeres subalbatus]|uniref:peroxisomal multifunctional enzyme A-like n=1 Tax=Armigeres subalbatus TaxID=124917 RepID=UPI002ECFE674
MSTDAFIEKLKARLAAVDPNAPRKVVGVFQLNIKTATGVEQYIIDLKQLKADTGVADSPDVTLTIALEDMQAIIGKTLTVSEALKSGKFEVSGNPELAAKLGETI